jgi:hypothetical protein
MVYMFSDPTKQRSIFAEQGVASAKQGVILTKQGKKRRYFAPANTQNRKKPVFSSSEPPVFASERPVLATLAIFSLFRLIPNRD